ncbi:MAG TPA: hypothetical protein VGK38_07750, partial [Prolixibacteraceae bacterium]
GHFCTHVLGITQTFLRLTKALRTDQDAVEGACKEADVIWRSYKSAQWKIKNDWMSSGLCALIYLRTVVKIMDGEIFLNPSLFSLPAIRPLLPFIDLLVMYAPPDLQENANYWLIQRGTDKCFEKDTEPQLKQSLQLLYEEMQIIANSRLSHQELVRQYKIRCENYEWKDLADTIESYSQKVQQSSDDTGKPARYEYEEGLTLHLARYLHDNGYSVHYTPREGVYEPDLLGKLSNQLDPIVVEAKVVGQKYGRSQGGPWIYNGLRALLSYLEKYHNDYGVTDGYLIVFRVGDEKTPTYTFDQSEWIIGQFAIMPVIINLCPINKKSPPVVITREELLRQPKE